MLKVATPATAFTVFVPDSTPPAGFVPMATVTAAVLGVRLPAASRIWTVTAGEIAAPIGTVEGWVPKTTRVAAPPTMLKAFDVAPVRPVLAAVRV